MYLWNRRKFVAPLVDLWEVGCRWELYPVISRENLPAPGQQRFPPPGASLRVEVARHGREVARGRLVGPAPRHGNRSPAPRPGRSGLGMRALAAAGLAGLAVSTAVYAIAAAELRWLRRTARGHRVPGFTPPVFILKRCPASTRASKTTSRPFTGWAYPRFELVFSFASTSDPAYPVARRVADRHPGVPTTFVFDPRTPAETRRWTASPPPPSGPGIALILFSDGNVRVHPDFLARAVSPLRGPARRPGVAPLPGGGRGEPRVAPSRRST